MRPDRGRDETSGGGVRAFLALPVDEACRRHLAGIVEGLRPRLAGVRWVAPDAMHLTLRFLGASPPEALARLEPPLEAAAARCPSARVPLTGTGIFPERGPPRVIWVGLVLNTELLALQRACEEAAVLAGFPREVRPFRPHLTLGRFKEARRAPELGALAPGETDLDRLVLFRSELGAGGAVHTPLRTWPLAGA
jgi:2'-5' RNA ligase